MSLFFRSLVSAALAALVLCVSLPARAVDKIDRYFQRPAGHSFLGNIGYSTTSYGERTLTWAGAASCVEAQGNCRLEFDYFVDSEQGWDYLRARVDGQVKLEKAGRNLAGRASIAVGPGSHLVRFSYEKDGSVDVGRDTAWIDNIEAVSPSGVGDSFQFLERNLAAPLGWTVGGQAGGWTIAARPQRRGLGRPGAHSHLGYQLYGTTSWVERNVYFSTAGYAIVRYFVDSELNYDYFRIKLDGAQIFQLSGPNKAGYARVNVATAGNHTLRFEYYKDTSVDVGLDIARVDWIRYYDSAQKLFSDENFDGEPIGTPQSWTCGGYGGCWHVRAVMPPRAYVAMQDPSVTPVVDGDINPEAAAVKEYENPNLFLMPDFGATQKEVAELALQPKPSTQQLFFGLRVASATSALGDEAGVLILYFDANHWLTLTGQGECSGAPEPPSANDRKIAVRYQIAPGQSMGSIVSTTQSAGTCASWNVVAPGSELPFTLAVSEKADNPGFVDIEWVVNVQTLPGFFSGAGYLGLGVIHGGTPYAGGTTSAERFPWLDYGPQDRDVTSWETLRRADPGVTFEVLENWFDGAPLSNKLHQFDPTL